MTEVKVRLDWCLKLTPFQTPESIINNVAMAIKHYKTHLGWNGLCFVPASAYNAVRLSLRCKFCETWSKVLALSFTDQTVQSPVSSVRNRTPVCFVHSCQYGPIKDPCYRAAAASTVMTVTLWHTVKVCPVKARPQDLNASTWEKVLLAVRHNPLKLHNVLLLHLRCQQVVQ